MLGRLAAASRVAARRSAFAAPPVLRSPLMGATRGAAQVSAPKPLSIRMDSLFVKCVIAALIYFVPQDAVFLTGLFWKWHKEASAISPKKKAADAEAALEEFKAKKGLDDVKVSKGRSTWYVSA